MKTCFKCHTAKPLEQFYRHSQMSDGHLNKCIECTKRDTAERVAKMSRDPVWAAAERKRHRIKSANARANGTAHVFTPEERKLIHERWGSNHPQKKAAHRAVKIALRRGVLVRQPCEQCGAFEVQAHHDDYAKPLEVRWLCVPHHNEHHVREREQQLFNQLKTTHV